VIKAGGKGTLMSVFTVDVKNQPGELARLCEAMASRGVNLLLSATAHGDGATVVFIVDDEDKARRALGVQVIPFTPAL